MASMFSIGYQYLHPPLQKRYQIKITKFAAADLLITAAFIFAVPPHLLPTQSPQAQIPLQSPRTTSRPSLTVSAPCHGLPAMPTPPPLSKTASPLPLIGTTFQLEAKPPSTLRRLRAAHPPKPAWTFPPIGMQANDRRASANPRIHKRAATTV